MRTKLQTPAKQVYGPKTLFPGKDRGRQLTVILTPQGHKAIETIQAKMTGFAENASIKAVSVNDAIEYALRREAKIGLEGMA